MTSRHATILLSLATAIAVACVDMSAPKGPASISVLRLPSPSVIIGDTMRDSNGVVTPLSIAAFDADGHPVSGFQTQFFITDTTKFAHIDTTTGLLVGDNSGTVHIIGQIGALQTPVASVPVTFRPAKVLRGVTLIDTIRAQAGPDSTSTGSATLPVVVHSANDSASAGIIVHYSLVHAPATQAGKPPAVVIFDAAGNPSLVDTTNASGATSHRLVVRPAFLSDTALLAGHTADSAIVVATVSYRHVPLAGSPITLVFPIKVVFK